MHSVRCLASGLAPIALHISQMLEANRILDRLAPAARHIVLGNDPHVMQEYPAQKPPLEPIAVRLDAGSTALPITLPGPPAH